MNYQHSFSSFKRHHFTKISYFITSSFICFCISYTFPYISYRRSNSLTNTLYLAPFIFFSHLTAKVKFSSNFTLIVVKNSHHPHFQIYFEIYIKIVMRFYVCQRKKIYAFLSSTLILLLKFLNLKYDAIVFSFNFPYFSPSHAHLLSLFQLHGLLPLFLCVCMNFIYMFWNFALIHG